MSIIPEATLTRVRLLEAQMKATVRKAVMESGHWKTATELAQGARLGPANPLAQLDNWKRAGRIFAIDHQGQDYFPVYGLAGAGRPLKGLAEVLEVFDGRKDAWALACWFAAMNSFLGGKRPQDVLEISPARVVAAAQDEIDGVLHG